MNFKVIAEYLICYTFFAIILFKEINNTSWWEYNRVFTIILRKNKNSMKNSSNMKNNVF